MLLICRLFFSLRKIGTLLFTWCFVIAGKLTADDVLALVDVSDDETEPSSIALTSTAITTTAPTTPLTAMSNERTAQAAADKAQLKALFGGGPFGGDLRPYVAASDDEAIQTKSTSNIARDESDEYEFDVETSVSTNNPQWVVFFCFFENSCKILHILV